jgi:hypothetical protein
VTAGALGFLTFTQYAGASGAVRRAKLLRHDAFATELTHRLAKTPWLCTPLAYGEPVLSLVRPVLRLFRSVSWLIQLLCRAALRSGLHLPSHENAAAVTPADAPFAELVQLSRKSIADEMQEDHRRRVLGE